MSEDEMSSFAERFSRIITKDACILLFGDLGAGKTFFSKCLISSLTNIDKNEIISPTFSIVSEYKSLFGGILHYDLYRVEAKEELFEIGLLDELGKSLLIIEWPEIALDFFSNKSIKLVKIFIEKTGEFSRKMNFESNFLEIKSKNITEKSD